MNIILENPDATHFVKRYTSGRVELNTGEYTQSILIHQDKVVSWCVWGIEQLDSKEIEAIVKLKPELVVLGTGEKQVFPEHAVLASLYNAKIGIEIMTTEAACRTYNILADEGRNVLAALIV